jgi:hypothetical protein
MPYRPPFWCRSRAPYSVFTLRILHAPHLPIYLSFLYAGSKDAQVSMGFIGGVCLCVAGINNEPDEHRMSVVADWQIVLIPWLGPAHLGSSGALASRQ